MFDRPIETLLDYQEFTSWACQGHNYEECSDDLRKRSHELAYNLIGLNEEAGEAAGKVKKAIRQLNFDDFAKKFEDKDERRRFLYELGDVLYYLSRCANMVGSDLHEVASLNKAKLEDRHARGVIKGEGDER